MDDREIQVQEIRKMLNMSHFQFINLLNQTDKHLITSFDEDFWKYQESIYATEPYFKRSVLDNPDLTVHILDLQNFIKDNPELSTNELFVVLDGDQSIDLGNAQAQIDVLKRDHIALQAALQEKDTRIAELEAALTGLQMNQKDMQSENRTDAATNARLRKTIQDWKDSLTAMVKVALQCGERGEKERTENEIKVMFEKNGDTITQAQLIEFKKALGPKHAKHSAGAPKQ